MLTKGMHLKLFFRSFFLQTGWNFSKYQHLGMAFTMWPFVKAVYAQDQKALPSVLERYLENFNTQPSMASFCIGALANQEERIAQAKTLAVHQGRLSEWNGIKRSLSITSASIGDRLFWGALKPLTLLMALCIWLVLNVNFFEVKGVKESPSWNVWGACIAAFLVFNILSLFVKWRGISLSYFAPDNGCFGLTQFDWNKTIFQAKRLGIILATILLLWGVLYFVHGWHDFIGIQFITRAVMVLFFVSISFMTRELRIPNMYIYISAMILFNIVCLFHL